ncbi:linear amide C-N hydrolase [Leucobacter sp. NPDC015123]|uniref:linear amide C-N hydrolase n=1 Tax=Leucobacter sp. NPDC015123 TaxID=3364129 RepID=UPI0036F49781
MCTRFLWSSAGTPGAGNVLVGRSMDWFEDTRTVLAIRPRGATRESAPGDPGSFEWTSEYGSVVCLMYGEIAVDGLNEAGFQVSGLYLAESDYGERDTSRPGLALAHAIQSMLDRFADVATAVTWLTESNVQIIPLDIGGKPGTGHIALADRSGDSAIIEFIDGETTVHHGSAYTVMANSPVYAEQLQLERRFAGLGGNEPLPGGTDSPDRFARAAFYSARLPNTEDEREASAYVFSVIRNASAPFGTADPVRPNVSTTRWRTVADMTASRFFFESTSSPNVVWVKLDKVDLSEGPELRFDPQATMAASGLVNEEFAAA